MANAWSNSFLSLEEFPFSRCTKFLLKAENHCGIGLNGKAG